MVEKVSTTEEALKTEAAVSSKASTKSVNVISSDSSAENKDQPIEAEADAEVVVEKIENAPVDLDKENSSRFDNKSRKN